MGIVLNLIFALERTILRGLWVLGAADKRGFVEEDKNGRETLSFARSPIVRNRKIAELKIGASVEEYSATSFPGQAHQPACPYIEFSS